jgi:A/G-specific adenine glycosylase
VTESAPPLLPAAAIRAIRRALFRWYDPRRRALPWRRSTDPYCVWVSEVMLQQTRIAVVVPAWERFLHRFPTMEALAAAPEEAVLAEWSGLGYYTRARSLHRAARTLVARGETRFPSDPERARALPGVGPYTLAAVLSIAYGQPLAAVDGNVVRVLSRLARLPRPDARQQPCASVADALLDPKRPGDWNQALMELGQTVCVPRRPACGTCPLRRHCQAFLHGEVALFPQPAPRRSVERVDLALVVVHDGSGGLLLEKGVFPFLTHLWLPLLPDAGLAAAPVVEHGFIRHAILHRLLTVRVQSMRLAPARMKRMTAIAAGERRMFAPGEIAAIGRSSLLTKVLRAAGLASGAQPALR